MTIIDQFMPMFQDEDSHQIHRAMSSIGHQCHTIQALVGYLSLMKAGPCSVSSLDHYSMPRLHVVINLNKLSLFPTPSID